MLQIQLLLIGAFVAYNIPMVSSIVCYQCTDCPEPFIVNYPYVSLTNNTNFLAQCTKTVITFGDGRRLITKGSVFYCSSQVASSDVQMTCCDYDYCNSSIRFGPSILLSFFIFIRIYL